MSNQIPILKHHSASSVSSFIENRAQWYRSKIVGDGFKGSKHTCRGTAVEAGINFWLAGDVDETGNAIKHALAVWDKETEFVEMSDRDRFDFKQSIGPLVNIGISSVQANYIEKLKCLPMQQANIQLDIPGCQFHAIGYLDWLFPQKLVVDNKVTGTSPSKIKQGYLIQAAVYNKATGLPVEFHFEVANKTPKAVILRPTDEELAYGWMLFCRGAKAIEFVFNNIQDKDFMDNFFLGNPEASYTPEERLDVLKNFGYLDEPLQ
jgi:hypothetical protein